MSPRSYESHDRCIEEAEHGERCCCCWRPIGKPTGKERLCYWCEKDRKEGTVDCRANAEYRAWVSGNREAGR